MKHSFLVRVDVAHEILTIAESQSRSTGGGGTRADTALIQAALRLLEDVTGRMGGEAEEETS